MKLDPIATYNTIVIYKLSNGNYIVRFAKNAFSDEFQSFNAAADEFSLEISQDME